MPHRKHFSCKILIWGSVVLLGLAILMEYFCINKKTDLFLFKKELRRKEKLAEKTFPVFYKRDAIDNFADSKLQKKLTDEEIFFYVYEDKELIYWSSNLIDVHEVYEDSYFNQALLKQNDGYYAVRNYSSQNRKVVALIAIYKEYQHPNGYLQNKFIDDFRMSHKTLLAFDAQTGHFISNKEGRFLFSINITDVHNSDTGHAYIISTLLLLGFLLLSMYFILVIKHVRYNTQLTFLAIYVLLILSLRYIMSKYHIPTSLYSLSLFSPKLHASSFFYSSLGDYWLNGLCFTLVLFALHFCKIANARWVASKELRYAAFFLCIFFSILFNAYVFEQIKSLVLNSTFSLQLHTGSGIAYYTLWAYSGAAFLIFALLLSLTFVYDLFHKLIPPKYFYSLCTLGILVAAFIFLPIDSIYLWHFGFISTLFIFRSLANQVKGFRTESFNLLSSLIVAALYLTLIINVFSMEKESQIRAAKAESITYTNNPIAKAMLEAMSSEWEKDKQLLTNFQDPIANKQQIISYLKSHYFTNYWSNYNAEIFICTAKNSIQLHDNQGKAYKSNCFLEFNNLVQSGERIGNSSFYELTSIKGVAPYIGMLSFITQKDGEVKLFIRLELKPKISKMGYPELLLGTKPGTDYYNRYSYAKYVMNKLRYSDGTFDYSSSFDLFQNIKGEKHPKRKDTATQIVLNNYNHYIYNITDNYNIIISEKIVSFYKKYIAFPYIFFLLLIIYFSIKLINNYPIKKIQFSFIEQQIRLAFIGLISLFFILIGGISLYYSYSDRQELYLNDHNAKIQLLVNELFSNINTPHELDVKYNSKLETKIRDYSRILGADINIYDTYGVLLSTSQPDIFSKGLLSYLMNYRALYKLTNHNNTEVIEREKIGNLEYSSIYVTLRNNQNKPIAYLNVPYFMKYKKFKMEMLDIIVAVLNLNFLAVLLALFVVFIIVQRITSPLVMIREKFSQLQLGKHNEKISYTQEDEIKALVDSYNQMIEELEKSTNLLTKAERESAWREMARQVAHEIKNPLTPMKLNIQFLQHKMRSNPEEWKDMFQATSQVLLQQIDELSSIASAFSDFAKMPTIQKEEIDLVPLLLEMVTLYNKGEIKVQLDINDKNIYIKADGNRLKRALINLITNAMQAIPEASKGVIIIKARRKKSMVKIQIKDNGKGIQDEIRDKIFTPNFTTKNSGTGLGLALTRDIVNQSGGTISFKTEVGVGTTFIITLPAI